MPKMMNLPIPVFLTQDLDVSQPFHIQVSRNQLFSFFLGKQVEGAKLEEYEKKIKGYEDRVGFHVVCRVSLSLLVQISINGVLYLNVLTFKKLIYIKT